MAKVLSTLLDQSGKSVSIRFESDAESASIWNHLALNEGLTSFKYYESFVELAIRVSLDFPISSLEKQLLGHVDCIVSIDGVEEFKLHLYGSKKVSIEDDVYGIRFVKIRSPAFRIKGYVYQGPFNKFGSRTLIKLRKKCRENKVRMWISKVNKRITLKCERKESLRSTLGHMYPIVGSTLIIEAY